MAHVPALQGHIYWPVRAAQPFQVWLDPGQCPALGSTLASEGSALGQAWHGGASGRGWASVLYQRWGKGTQGVFAFPEAGGEFVTKVLGTVGCLLGLTFPPLSWLRMFETPVPHPRHPGSDYHAAHLVSASGAEQALDPGRNPGWSSPSPPHQAPSSRAQEIPSPPGKL